MLYLFIKLKSRNDRELNASGFVDARRVRSKWTNLVRHEQQCRRIRIVYTSNECSWWFGSVRVFVMPHVSVPIQF